MKKWNKELYTRQKQKLLQRNLSKQSYWRAERKKNSFSVGQQIPWFFSDVWNVQPPVF